MMVAESKAADAGDFALRIQKLTKKFGGQPALLDVTFDVPRNSIFGLLGPNGAGKTTLFSVVAGFLRPTSGAVECLGIDVAHNISSLRGKLSILPQDAAFQGNVPVLEQMIFFCQLSGYGKAEAEKEAMRALSLVGLAEVARKNARLLSHGMIKRVGIAQAFLGKPEVVLLDEPTAGLDPINAAGIRKLIREFPREGTLIISSHDLPEIQEMCSHVAILDRGKLVECATVSSIVQTNRKTRMLFARPINDAELGVIMAVKGVKGVTGGYMPGEYVIDSDPGSVEREQSDLIAEMVGKLAGMGLVPKAVSEGESLERRFLQVTGDKKKKEE
jgi:ABC-type multidrug transport system ATPase subunit